MERVCQECGVRGGGGGGGGWWRCGGTVGISDQHPTDSIHAVV